MTPLVLHEIRIAARRAAWPAVLVLHAVTSALFVAIWGPTGGVPLWQASTLDQLATVDRLATAVLFTWFATHILADDDGRGLVEWSALTGRPTDGVFRARVAAAGILGAVFVIVSGPAFVAAAEGSAATAAGLLIQAGAAIGFAIACLGVTAAVSVSLSDRVAVWCTAMSICLVAALGVRFLESTLLRAVVPAATGALLMTIAPLGARARVLTR